MIEQLYKWEPLIGLSEKYYTESITSNFKKGLIILLVNSNDSTRKIKITFKYFPEAFKILTTECLRREYQEVYESWTFFKMTQSFYLKWLSEESYEVSDFTGPFIHFCFVTQNKIIDILDYDIREPHVEFMDMQ